MNTNLDTKAIRAVAAAANARLYVDANGKPILDEFGGPRYDDRGLCATCGSRQSHDHHKDCAALAACVGCIKAYITLRDQGAGYLIALCDELDELRATLENERGHGTGPSPGWHWSNGRQAWIYQPWLRVPKETGPEAVVRRGPLGWELYFDGLRTPDEYLTARAAMIAADKTRSPA